ncbi:MAG: polyribonucleotide nucleotidyltransferase [Candidatus Omnitrophica bacterium]|nr:polyribonucleotide nucleotidyltransferase [Candidatus Omnitrophota bacterium]
MTIQRVSATIGNREVIIETGRMAKQSNGAVTVQCGGTVILATVVQAREADEERDFFPLTVDYRERTYAAGKIPGGFFKREGRPSEKEILTSRLIDRPIRPLFSKDYRNEVQIMVTVLSADGENNPDILAMIGASAALLISDIPFTTPVGSVRVGLQDGKFIVNPNYEETEKGDLDLVVAGTEEKAIMLEAGAREISEEEMIKAILFAQKELRAVIQLQKELQGKAGKKKLEVKKREIPAEVSQKASQAVRGSFEKIFDLGSKEEREDALAALYEKVLAQFDAASPDFKEADVKYVFDELEKKRVREIILNEKKRPDGRGFKEIREVSCEIAPLPRTHGSAIFTRGQTQSLAVATLGTKADEQTIDALEGEGSKRFMLHYNFPPFSVGEVGPNRGPGRREIGHGALAERALKSVMPDEEKFPYTVRIVSDILESNGSSSMASACSATLALMDAGVPIKGPVGGIAIGLITEGNKWQVLTDIAGIEDHLGDMDLKGAGTEKGLTALQMDLKIPGITEEILREAMCQAKEARMHILKKMAEAISTPRKELSAYAPRITTLRINPSKIGEVIGPGGKVIRKIVEETGAKVEIEDDGRVLIASSDPKASEEAIARVKAIVEDAEIGKIYQGRVRKIMNFGAFCEILPGTDGLVHISEIAEGFVKQVEDHLKVGDVVPVKVISIDKEGKINLSMIQAKDGEGPPVVREARTSSREGEHRGDRDRGPRNRSRERHD